MATISHVVSENVSGLLDVSRVPVRSLAAMTAAACAVGLLLSHVIPSPAPAHGGPLNIVIGQAIWNAAQVGLLLVLLCMWLARRLWWVAVLGVATLASLPFAIYAISPGAWVLTPLLLATCALAWLRGAPVLKVSIVDAPARGTSTLSKFEFLALVVTLLCSLYNYNASRDMWPHWNSLFASLAGVIGFTAEPAAIANTLYTVGLPGVAVPDYVPGSRGNNLGALFFVMIWSVLPFLYVVYFALLAKMARDTPGAMIQRVLCAICIAHFLFLTDVVDYKFGRGIENAMPDLAHWVERFVWRIAILLPIYQKVASGYWLRGNGLAGVLLHWGLAAWAVLFVVYQVTVYDLTRFAEFLTTGEVGPLPRLFGMPYTQELGYHGALVLMTTMYAIMVLTMRAKRIVATPREA